MTEQIYQHIANFNKSKGWEDTEEGVIDTILEIDTIYSETTTSRRHWNETFNVVEIDGILIGYEGATTTGDQSPRDKGWEFDPKTICEVEKKEVTKTIYSPIK